MLAAAVVSGGQREGMTDRTLQARNRSFVRSLHLPYARSRSDGVTCSCCNTWPLSRKMRCNSSIGTHRSGRRRVWPVGGGSGGLSQGLQVGSMRMLENATCVVLAATGTISPSTC